MLSSFIKRQQNYQKKASGVGMFFADFGGEDEGKFDIYNLIQFANFSALGVDLRRWIIQNIALRSASRFGP